MERGAGVGARPGHPSPEHPVAQVAGTNGAAAAAAVGARRVAVIGMGYVGLPTALMLAHAGFDVTGVDTDPARVREINEGPLTRIDEPDIHALMADSGTRSRLHAQAAPGPADAFILAVPTPLDPEQHVADLTYLRSAARAVLPVLRPGNLVVVESTVPPGTCRDVIAPIVESAGFRVRGDNPEILLAHCPERVLPGNIAHELVHNDRVIGGLTPAAAEAAREVYGRFVEGRIYLTDAVTAELCKLMENTYRDVNIALANEFSAVAETLGVSATEAISLANRHPRVRILTPGIGVGGHCIPIDPWFIHQVDPAHSTLIAAARAANDAVPARVAARIRAAVAEHVEPAEARIVAIGATYKPNTNDTRESPAIEVVHALRAMGCHVQHVDPVVPEMAGGGLVDLARGADCLVVLVQHESVMAELAAQRESILGAMRRPLILVF